MRDVCNSYRAINVQESITESKCCVLSKRIIICSLDENLHCWSSSVQWSQVERRVPFFKGDGITTVNLGFCLHAVLSGLQ